MKNAFTLIELLIVIALLAGIAMIVIPNLVGDKKDVTDTIIQSELAEIQRAFFRFKNDCVLQPKHYQTVAQYGVSVLLEQEINGKTLFESWDNDRQRGWRGAYLTQDDKRFIDPDSVGQQESGNVEVAVICCSNNADNQSDYYRILATNNKGVILEPKTLNPNEVHQLWLVYPYPGFLKTQFSEIVNENKKYYRQLLEEEVTEFDTPPSK
ncbi:MAG: type II secretion system GspH family protein [Planctomycetaceae bacterium]|jgi:prepilin-type N-terminal cleavage/methylation domain-containing protein|nr:type II secretion system GspH family protein [Planctomycetaceae bacterium]